MSLPEFWAYSQNPEFRLTLLGTIRKGNCPANALSYKRISVHENSVPAHEHEYLEANCFTVHKDPEKSLGLTKGKKSKGKKRQIRLFSLFAIFELIPLLKMRSKSLCFKRFSMNSDLASSLGWCFITYPPGIKSMFICICVTSKF